MYIACAFNWIANTDKVIITFVPNKETETLLSLLWYFEQRRFYTEIFLVTSGAGMTTPETSTSLHFPNS